MAVNALIQFTQGPNTDIAGRAVKGTLTDGDVTITNGDNTDIQSWTIDLIYVPPGSGLSVATPFASGSNSSTPTAVLPQPDARGCYRVRLTVYDQPNYAGTSSQDIRNFAIPEENGTINPPFQVFPPQLPYEGSGNPAEKPDELNFGGQLFGWAGDDDASRPMMFQNVREVDRFKGLFSTTGDRGSAVVLGGPNVVNPTRPVFDGSDLWVGAYPSSSSTPENGYTRSSGTAELTVTFNEDQSFDYTEGGSDYYNSMVAYDSDNDRMVIVRMNRNDQAGELFVAALSKNSPAVKGPDTNLQAILASPVTGLLMDVFTTPGYLWIIREVEILRVDLSNFSNVTRVYAPGYGLEGYHVYDPTDRYGDGEGRIWVVLSGSTGLIRIKPSTGVVDLGPTQPNNLPTFYFINTYGIGMDVVNGRMYLAFQGFIDSTISQYLAAFDVDPLFDNVRAFDWSDAGNADYERVYNFPFDVVAPSEAGFCYALANRESDQKATFWVFEDTGTTIDLSYAYPFGGTTIGPGIGLAPDSLSTDPIPPRFTFFPDATIGDTTFIAHPGYFSYDGFVLGIRFTPPVTISTRPMTEGVDGFGQSVVAQLAGDLEPGYGLGSPESPAVTGMYGAPFNFSGISSGSLVVAITNGSAVSSWQDKLFPWGRSYRVSSGGTYQPSAGDISMVVGMSSSGIATVRIPTQKGVPSTSNANQRSFISAFGDQIGQAGSSFNVIVNPDDLIGNGEIYGIGSSSIDHYRIRNRDESLELGWAYDSGVDPVGRWTVTNRYRPWENIEVTSTPVSILPGKAMVQVRTSTGAKTVILPSEVFNDDWIIVKDIDGNAAVNNITISGGSTTIDGASTYVIDANLGSVILRYSDVEDEWHVVATLGGTSDQSEFSQWAFNSTTTMADPGYATFRLNGVWNAATQIALSEFVHAAGSYPFVESILNTLATGDILVLRQLGDNVLAIVTVSGSPTNNTGWQLIPITWNWWTGATATNGAPFTIDIYKSGSGGGGTDADAIHDNVAGEIAAITAKATPVSADLVIIEDSEDSNNKKAVQVGTLPASDADAIHDNVAGEIAAVTEKATPVAADLVIIEDSADSNNKKRVQVGNLPASDADAIHDNVAGEIAAITEKATPVSADLVIIEDSADSNNKKRAQVGTLPATDATAIHTDVAGEILAVTQISQLQAGDGFIVEDASLGNVKRMVPSSYLMDFNLITIDAGGVDPAIDWNPTGWDYATVVRIDAGGAAVSLRGFYTLGLQHRLRKKLIIVGEEPVTFRHNANGIDENFFIPGQSDLTLQPGDIIELTRDTVSGVWRLG